MRGPKAARGALAKIAAVLPPERAEALDWPTLLAGASRTGEGEGASLPLIRQALAGGRKLKLDYLGKDGRPSARVVLPAALGFFDPAQMLAAWCETREAFRNFRLDGMAAAAAIEAGCETLQSADFQPGRRIADCTIVNPFL